MENLHLHEKVTFTWKIYIYMENLHLLSVNFQICCKFTFERADVSLCEGFVGAQMRAPLKKNEYDRVLCDVRGILEGGVGSIESP